MFEANFHGGTWNLEYTDEGNVPVSLGQTAQAKKTLVAAYFGDDAVKTGIADLKSYGLGRWDIYDDGSRTGLAKELPSTSVIVIAKDQNTAEALAHTLIAAADTKMPGAG